MIATVNDLWPGRLPVGTTVEIVSQSQASVLVRVGKKTIKASPKWLDFPTETPDPITFKARPLRREGSVLDD